MSSISITLAYAPTADTQELITLHLAKGATALDALTLSGLFNGSNLTDLPLGVFSKRVNSDHVLNLGDRLEVYRPLTQDPKKQRKQKAKRSSNKAS